jgi:hypothetical protein
MSEPAKNPFDLLIDQIRTAVREEIAAALEKRKPAFAKNELLRDIANTLDVDAIVGFRVNHGVVCWNCIRSTDEPRRLDVVYGAEGGGYLCAMQGRAYFLIDGVILFCYVMVHDEKTVAGYSRRDGTDASRVRSRVKNFAQQCRQDGNRWHDYNSADGATYPVCGAGGGC